MLGQTGMNSMAPQQPGEATPQPQIVLQPQHLDQILQNLPNIPVEHLRQIGPQFVELMKQRMFKDAAVR